jgi:hypothetical protein
MLMLSDLSDTFAYSPPSAPDAMVEHTVNEVKG